MRLTAHSLRKYRVAPSWRSQWFSCAPHQSSWVEFELWHPPYSSCMQVFVAALGILLPIDIFILVTDRKRNLPPPQPPPPQLCLPSTSDSSSPQNFTRKQAMRITFLLNCDGTRHHEFMFNRDAVCNELTSAWPSASLTTWFHAYSFLPWCRYLADWWNLVSWLNYIFFIYNLMQQLFLSSEARKQMLLILWFASNLTLDYIFATIARNSWKRWRPSFQCRKRQLRSLGRYMLLLFLADSTPSSSFLYCHTVLLMSVYVFWRISVLPESQ